MNSELAEGSDDHLPIVAISLSMRKHLSIEEFSAAELGLIDARASSLLVGSGWHLTGMNVSRLRKLVDGRFFFHFPSGLWFFFLNRARSCYASPKRTIRLFAGLGTQACHTTNTSSMY